LSEIRTVVCRVAGRSFFKIVVSEANFQVKGISAVCRGILNRISNGYEIQCVVFSEETAGRPSGPPLLLALNNLIYFLIKSGVKTGILQLKNPGLAT
jgi:hypothetical protein